MLDKNKFKGAMMSAGFTQQSLAKSIKMSVNTMSSRVNGRSSFSTEEVSAICKALEIEDAREIAEIFLN